MGVNWAMSRGCFWSHFLLTTLLWLCERWVDRGVGSIDKGLIDFDIKVREYDVGISEY
jgi:hypothetical protein